MGGKGSDALIAFIESIPADKLKYLGSATIYKTRDFRLDNQGITSGDPQCYNLQIQINKETRVSTLKKHAPKTVAGPVLVPVDTVPDPDELREEFIKAKRIP